MNSKIKKGLGRGLSSLIGETKVESKTNGDHYSKRHRISEKEH